jgi:precorrin-2 dehydrogenase/sirohydrochlorin ferrochelatase
MQQLYPIFLNIEGKPCLVVGGGEVAGRKAALLLDSGARVTVVSPETSGEIRALLDEGKIKHIKENFKGEHLEGFCLVVGSTDDPRVNNLVSEGARKRGIWVNIVDSPAESDFFVPSLVRRGDLTVAISTGGSSPATAKKVRKVLEAQLGEEYALLINFLGKLRADAFASIEMEKDRASLYTQMVDSDILPLLKKGKKDKARAEAEKILKSHGLPYKKEYLG